LKKGMMMYQRVEELHLNHLEHLLNKTQEHFTHVNSRADHKHNN